MCLGRSWTLCGHAADRLPVSQGVPTALFSHAIAATRDCHQRFALPYLLLADASVMVPVRGEPKMLGSAP